MKLDRGGIRDIEFLVQCLQRVYGGAEGWLHSPGTLFALQKLHDKEHLSSQDVQRLTGAYQFLRTVEHRLQLRRGQQLHRLPASHKELEIMARSVSRAGNGTTSAERFLREINTLMADVAEIYDRVVYREQSHSLQPAQEFQLLPPASSTHESSYRDQFLQRLAEDAPRFETSQPAAIFPSTYGATWTASWSRRVQLRNVMERWYAHRKRSSGHFPSSSTATI